VAAVCAPDDERARLMRWVICAAFVVALAPSAFAADLDILRGTQTVGPATFTRWSGFYAGGEFGYSSANVDFSKATQPLIADSLRNTTLEIVDHVSQGTALTSNNLAHATGWGGFAGYNTQWQDLVLGIEGTYTHAPFSVVAVDHPLLGHVVSASGTTYSVNITGSGSLEVTDFGSVRARAGYAFGSFLPYGFAGVALGRGTYNVTSEIYGQGNSGGTVPCDPNTVPTCFDYDLTNGASKTSALLYGFVVGGGLDVAVTQNIFVRGEYEFMQFAPFANITATISSARVGAGFKF
jgi:outer membrane immunogenic protein